MLKNKLVNRGYEVTLLRNRFLRFCTFYHAPYKYGHTDVALWDMTEDEVFGGSCMVDDRKAVAALTKPCSIVLKDLYPKKYKDISVPTPNTPASNSTPSQNSSILPIPIPLVNPQNHCYLNSILQVFFRLKDLAFHDISINSSSEGQLVKSIKDSLLNGSEAKMAHLKNSLSNYNSFFDGIVQRDAYECFQLFREILHGGTKHSILGSDSDQAEDDEFIVSAAKSLFSFLFKKTLTCFKCELSSVFYIQASEINIYPSNLQGLHALINEAMESTLQKGCNCSNKNTKHSELLEFEGLPNILCIIVNRYTFNSSGRKNEAFITIEKSITINEQIFDHLATVYHHGATTSSGHYTTKISYADAAYICDDHCVSLTDIISSEKSKSCYILFYSKRS